MEKPIPVIKINLIPLKSAAFDMGNCSRTELIIPIEKALDTSKLVKRLVSVTHNGKTYQAMRWVRPNEAASQELQEPRDSEDHLLAPNGNPSHLNEKQWHRVRTPEFKKWFGDWELSEKKVLLTGPAIKKIKSGVIRGDENTKPIEAALKWAKKNIQESIDAVIGEIIINERGIKDSLSHGFSQKKLDSIQALPDVLKSGILLGSVPDYKGDRIVNHFFAAPIELDNERNILFVRVRGSENGKHFYVHEIFLEREIKELETHQTIAESEDSRPHRGLKLYKNILQKIYAVNPNSVSKIIDENGEPLVVYKGMMKNDWRTGKEIESIDSSNGQWAGFFTDRKDVAEKFQRVFSTMGEAVLHSVYLSIQNPYVYDANGALARDVMFDDVVFGKNPTNPDALAAFNKEYDGVIIKNTEDEGTIYVPKNPNQIKSINANEFDPGSPNFNKSIGERMRMKENIVVPIEKPLTFSGWKLQGRKKVQGMDISIENKKGSYRRAQEAKELYMKQYDRPGFFGSMDETDIETFKKRAFADSAKGKKLVIKSCVNESMMRHVKDVVNSMLGSYTDLGLSSSERHVFDGVVQQKLAKDLERADGKKVRNGTREELSPQRLGVKFYTEESLHAGNPKAKEIIGGLRELSRQLEDEIERKYPKELEVGIRVEKEHTDDPETAKIIAMAHIKETPDYYTKLIAAGLVDEPEAIKMAKKIGIAKALPKAGSVENSRQSAPNGYPNEKKEYADPNNYKYPLDTEEHVRAAISYFSKPSNFSMYSLEERRAMWARIVRAAQKHGIMVSEKDKFRKSIHYVIPIAVNEVKL